MVAQEVTMLSLKKHRRPLDYYGYFHVDWNEFRRRWDSRDGTVYWYCYNQWKYCDFTTVELRNSKKTVTELYDPRFVVIKNTAYYIDLLDKLTESLHNKLRLSSSSTQETKL